MNFDFLYCQDTSCKIYTNALNVYLNNIIDVCLLASEMCIRSTNKMGMVGQNEDAEPARNEANFWPRLWVDNGRPSHISDIRHRTRYDYKRIVKCSREIRTD